jgi:hypothetical protein
MGVYTMDFHKVDSAWKYIKGSGFGDPILLGGSASSNPVAPDPEMQVRCHAPTSDNGCATCNGTGWPACELEAFTPEEVLHTRVLVPCAAGVHLHVSCTRLCACLKRVHAHVHADV